MKKSAFNSIICLALLILATLVCNASAADSQTKSKIILDTDIGTDIDDAWALAFVLSYKGFEPLGVTITDADTPARAKIACKRLHLANRGKIPVAIGRQTATPAGRIDYQFSWAEDFTLKKPIDQPAADFIVNTIKRNPGEVTLIGIGPLQNIADALRIEPNLARYVKRVVLMSGCIYGTAWTRTPIAEWNVVTALTDSQIVYSSGLPITIIPLDSTSYVQLASEERDEIRARNSLLTRSLEALYRLWISSPASRMTMHDQMAVAEAASPGRFFGKKESLLLKVDDKGFTRIDNLSGKPVEVCLEPRRDDFVKYFISELLQ